MNTKKEGHETGEGDEGKEKKKKKKKKQAPEASNGFFEEGEEGNVGEEAGKVGLESVGSTHHQLEGRYERLDDRVPLLDEPEPEPGLNFIDTAFSR
eukprot:CAMPEP_0206564958 /NCGR_PEP_ID=MMETSP0325_2-20121206/23780_1 /ASSEMBLY_ACC=CAM_ASM_000347 /TAXON_ID=2866 /ORGANISM="Crypthecodinium cohnii, Strain Seligo" /LENGTH=95 /DNA_ID=CAMNT_0054067711 /DNA_START=174 /DNA_END=462 /DNA_ORIENTATION=-